MAPQPCTPPSTVELTQRRIDQRATIVQRVNYSIAIANELRLQHPARVDRRGPRRLFDRTRGRRHRGARQHLLRADRPQVVVSRLLAGQREPGKLRIAVAVLGDQFPGFQGQVLTDQVQQRLPLSGRGGAAVRSDGLGLGDLQHLRPLLPKV